MRRIQLAITLTCMGPISTLLAGCQSAPGPAGLETLSDPDPLVRVSAIKWAGENKVTDAVEPLVDCLADEESAVRFFAIQALVKITGQDHGYDYKDDARRRLQAIERWRQSIEESLPAAQSPQPES